jgi:hypothetical protein
MTEGTELLNEVFGEIVTAQRDAAGVMKYYYYGLEHSTDEALELVRFMGAKLEVEPPTEITEQPSSKYEVPMPLEFSAALEALIKEHKNAGVSDPAIVEALCFEALQAATRAKDGQPWHGLKAE